MFTKSKGQISRLHIISASNLENQSSLGAKHAILSWWVKIRRTYKRLILLVSTLTLKFIDHLLDFWCFRDMMSTLSSINHFQIWSFFLQWCLTITCCSIIFLFSFSFSNSSFNFLISSCACRRTWNSGEAGGSATDLPVAACQTAGTKITTVLRDQTTGAVLASQAEAIVDR